MTKGVGSEEAAGTQWLVEDEDVGAKEDVDDEEADEITGMD